MATKRNAVVFMVFATLLATLCTGGWARLYELIFGREALFTLLNLWGTGPWNVAVIFIAISAMLSTGGWLFIGWVAKRYLKSN